jgi:PKD domain
VRLRRTERLSWEARPRLRRGRASWLLAALAALFLALAAPQAGAVILPATTIDGPSENIVGFGGVAMASDGTGGLVYLKRVAGVPHVFVSRYLQGHWQSPIRVDTEQPYAASWPRIGAASGGELVVVWATPFATEQSKQVFELLSATLGPGAAGFAGAMIVDRDIREAAGTSPDLAMSSTGQADVVYRVVHTFAAGQTSEIPLLRPGDVVEDVRVAHFNGETWSALGAINRDSGVSMRPPTFANAPQIAVGQTGSGIVVWQEPDINGVGRIWARRLFGATLDYVLPVSATSFNAMPINDDADAPSVGFSRLGQAEVAYRQPAAPGSPLPGPRIFLNTLPDGESADGSQFSGASVLDSAVGGGTSATVGPPDIDIDEKQNMRTLYDSNGTPRVIEGNNRGLSGALSLGPGIAGAEVHTAIVMNPAGGSIAAWSSADAQGHPGVAVREEFPGGALQTALVRGGAGGEIGELSVGRSGLGDGLIAFQQGPLGNAAIVADQATAPPVQFVVTAPSGWVKPGAVAISWQQATSANGPLTYKVVLDGRLQPTPRGAFASRLSARGLGSGRHRLQVLATDIDGQSVLTPTESLLVDGSPPVVKVSRSRHGASVAVLVADAQSGVNKRATHISFGDGTSASGKARLSHRYARPGVYTVVVHGRDKVGNRGVFRRLVIAR